MLGIAQQGFASERVAILLVPRLMIRRPGAGRGPIFSAQRKRNLGPGLRRGDGRWVREGVDVAANLCGKCTAPVAPVQAGAQVSNMLAISLVGSNNLHEPT